MKQRKKTEILQTSIAFEGSSYSLPTWGNNNGSDMCAIYDQFNKIIAVVQK